MLPTRLVALIREFKLQYFLKRTYYPDNFPVSAEEGSAFVFTALP